MLSLFLQVQNKGNAATKKTARRKKGAQVSKNAPSISEEEVEKRLTAIQDLTYEEAIQEAIINSKITFEEEHAKQVSDEAPPSLLLIFTSSSSFFRRKLNSKRIAVRGGKRSNKLSRSALAVDTV